jgi:hypothetical protein
MKIVMHMRAYPLTGRRVISNWIPDDEFDPAVAPAIVVVVALSREDPT